MRFDSQAAEVSVKIASLLLSDPVQYKSRTGLAGWAPGPGPGWVMFHCSQNQYGVMAGCVVCTAPTADSPQLSPRLSTDPGGYSLIEKTVVIKALTYRSPR